MTANIPQVFPPVPDPSPVNCYARSTRLFLTAALILIALATIPLGWATMIQAGTVKDPSWKIWMALGIFCAMCSMNCGLLAFTHSVLKKRLNLLLKGTSELLGGWTYSTAGYAYFSMKGVYTQGQWFNFHSSVLKLGNVRITDDDGDQAVLRLTFVYYKDHRNQMKPIIVAIPVPAVALDEARRLAGMITGPKGAGNFTPAEQARGVELSGQVVDLLEIQVFPPMPDPPPVNPYWKHTGLSISMAVVAANCALIAMAAYFRGLGSPGVVLLWLIWILGSFSLFFSSLVFRNYLMGKRLQGLLDGGKSLLGGWHVSGIPPGYAYFSRDGVFTNGRWLPYRGPRHHFLEARVLEDAVAPVLQVDYETPSLRGGRRPGYVSLPIPGGGKALDEAKRIVALIGTKSATTV